MKQAEKDTLFLCWFVCDGETKNKFILFFFENICIFQKKAVPLPLIFDFNRIKMQNMRHFDEKN